MASTDPRLLALLDEPLARALRAAAGDTPCHLVGGILRDRLLGIDGRDFDAVVAANGERIGEQLAGRMPARLVRLGGRRFAAYRLAGAGFTLDLWDRQGGGLEEDLARRDFTVNAFALDVAGGAVTDPFAGLADLERRHLRATTPAVFAADPLRVLRLVRLTLQLPRFSPEPATVDLAGEASAGLRHVAAERVREELVKIVTSRQLATGFELLARLALYPGLLLGRPGEPGEAGAARRLLRRLEPALAHLDGLAGLPHGRLESAAARLAVLFSGLDPRASAALEALEGCRRTGYLGGRDAARCRRLIGCREAPGGEPAARRFLHRWGADWPTAAATLAALAEPPLDAAGRRRLLDGLAGLARAAPTAIFAPPPLLDGEEIQRLLGIPPGPAVGRAVALLRRAQVEGRVGDRDGAEALLRRSASDAG